MDKELKLNVKRLSDFGVTAWSFDSLPDDGPVYAKEVISDGKAFVAVFGLRGEPDGRHYPVERAGHIHGKTWAHKKFVVQVREIIEKHLGKGAASDMY